MKQIAAALVKAQKAFGPALKTTANPFFKSKYADLSACVEAVIDGLNENGVFLAQNCHECPDGVTVETVFIHESGETYSAGKLHVPAAKNDPQGYGSALTYARRYSLMAACGIAPEDDDGNAASRPKAPVTPLPESAKSIAKSDYDKLTPERQNALTDLATEIKDAFSPQSPEIAYDVYRHVMEALPLIEEKAALKSLLDSKIRTAFVKIYKERNTQLTPAGELATQA